MHYIPTYYITTINRYAYNKQSGKSKSWTIFVIAAIKSVEIRGVVVLDKWIVSECDTNWSKFMLICFNTGLEISFFLLVKIWLRK